MINEVAGLWFSYCGEGMKILEIPCIPVQDVHLSYEAYLIILQKQVENLVEGKDNYSAAERLVGNRTGCCICEVSVR